MSPRPAPVIWGGCPRCQGNKVKCLPQNGHLAWDVHTYPTWSGTRIPCSASGLHLCDLPPRDVEYLTGKPVPTCPHK